MSDQSSRASLTRSQGRPGWIISFRHPSSTAPDGTPRPKLRRGLGTPDESTAQRIKDQLNELLANESLWSPAARDSAKELYDPLVIKIFYDDLVPPTRDSWHVRERIIPLPTYKDGYAVAQLVGATAAGKTTLGRQIIGTDPKTERFPSTASAKTTTCDLEIILEGPSYRAAVTFLPRDEVRQQIEECILAAVFRYVETGRHDELVRKFLVHGEQRFRLDYILGTWSGDTDEDDAEELQDQEDPAIGSSGPEEDLPSGFLADATADLQRFLDAIRDIASAEKAKLEEEFGKPFDEFGGGDQTAFEEVLEEDLVRRPDFSLLIDEVLDAVERRFTLVTRGEIELDAEGWPAFWKLNTDDREVFIRTVNRFSSNYAPRFGTLLTPLVDGIRVAGPFRPDWLVEGDARLVLLDGEGMGHTPDSFSNVPMKVTRRYQLANAILLVDNAAVPMQSASAAVLKSLVRSGHESKLVICFTHFDQVTGDSMPTLKARQSHLRNSVDNAIRGIGKALDHEAEVILKKSVFQKLFFLENLQDGRQISSSTKAGLNRLVGVIRALAVPPEPPVLIPVYDDANLIFRLQTAAQEFHEPWASKLGFQTHPEYRQEHWSRIKALSRRLANRNPAGYDSLNPIDDFIGVLESNISLFLQSPIAWEPVDGSSEKKQAAIASVKQQLHILMEGFAIRRMLQEQIDDWKRAYDRFGPGSTRPRARDIERIYDVALPVPGEEADPNTSTFLRVTRELVKHAVKAGGGKLISIAEPVVQSQPA